MFLLLTSPIGRCFFKEILSTDCNEITSEQGFIQMSQHEKIVIFKTSRSVFRQVSGGTSE